MKKTVDFLYPTIGCALGAVLFAEKKVHSEAFASVS